MIKVISFLFSFFFLFFTFSNASHAADPNFSVSVDSSYLVQDSGITTLTQTVHIKNNAEYYYTPSYTVNVGFKDIQNLQASNADGSIPTSITDNSTSKSIKLTFPKRYTGLNNVHTFTITLDTKDIAKKQGNIWEVTIPGISNPSDFDKYTATVEVPNSFGKPSIVKPEKKTSGAVTFSKNEIGKGGVYILYGDKQYYKFTLSYNISNPNLFPVRTEIALPPQTGYQNVSIASFSQTPLNTSKDQDGNWIAEYRLLPQEKKKITVKGFVEILSSSQNEEMILNDDYLSSAKFWDTKDESVIKIAKTLKTPEDIYDYVTSALSYNYSKVATDNLRLGGKGALQDKKNSVCLEFTDLFITLARAAGIPARAVEGYAYTQNPKLRPLMANDILHAWPEYYDDKKKRWIMVDPTWGNTTNGIDYFNSLDFQHVAFVLKGFDSEYPIPAGGYKFQKDSKDVEIEFADASDFLKVEKLSLDSTFPNIIFPKTIAQGSFVVKNSGTIAIANATAIVTTSQGSKRQFLLDYIPPGGERKITTSFADVPFLTNKPYIITMQIGKTIYSKKIRISFIPELQQLLIIGGIISGSIIVAAVTFHTGSVLVQRRKGKNSIRR